jgi:hypothetical protein
MLVVSLAISSLPLSQLYEAHTKDFYWAHVDMKLPLEAGKGYFEIYVKNELLQRSLENERIATLEGENIVPLTVADFSVRLNKKCEFMTMPLAFSVAALSASLIFLLLLLRSLLMRKQVHEQNLGD